MCERVCFVCVCVCVCFACVLCVETSSCCQFECVLNLVRTSESGRKAHTGGTVEMSCTRRVEAEKRGREKWRQQMRHGV